MDNHNNRKDKDIYSIDDSLFGRQNMMPRTAPQVTAGHWILSKATSPEAKLVAKKTLLALFQAIVEILNPDNENN